MPIFFSSAPDRKSGRAALDDEARELFAIDLREHDVNVGESAVGDPHLLAVQDPVLAVGRKHRARARGQRVRTGLRLGKAVAGEQFAGGDLRQVFFLLLFGAEIDDGDRADAGVGAVRNRERRVPRQFFRQHRRGNLVESRAAVFFRDCRRPAGPVRPLSSATAASGLLCAARVRGSCGTTSLATNSSAVWPIRR